MLKYNGLFVKLCDIDIYCSSAFFVDLRWSQGFFLERIEMAIQAKQTRRVQLDAAVIGPVFMLSAALSFTLLNLLLKLLGSQYTVWSIGFYRFFGGAAVLIAVFGRYHNPYKGHNIRLLIIRGCTGCSAFLCIVTAIRLLPVSTALIIYYSYPAFAAIFSFIIYKERIGMLEIACIAAVLIGVGILFDFELVGGVFGQIMALVGGCVCRVDRYPDTILARKKRTGNNLSLFLHHGHPGYRTDVCQTPGVAFHTYRMGYDPGPHLCLGNRPATDESGFFLLPRLGRRGFYVQ